MEKAENRKTETIALFLELKKEGARFLVVGGFAANLYGVERATYDIDMAVPPDPDHLSRFLAVLQRLGYGQLIDAETDKVLGDLDRADINKILELDSVRVKNRRTVDILIVPSARFDYLWQYHVDLDYHGAIIPLPNPMDLIHMKEQSSRRVDHEDAKALRHLLRTRKKK